MSPAPPTILDLHSSTGGASLAASLSKSLQPSERITPAVLLGEESLSYTRSIPTEVLYSAKGLEIYDQITKLKEYYPFAAELEILQTHGDEIACRMLGLDSSLLSPPAEEDDPKIEKEPIVNEPSPAANGAGKKEKWGDELVGRFNEGVNGKLNPSHRERIGSAVELGSGSLDKTRHLLRSLNKVLNPPKGAKAPFDRVEYRALDLERSSLVQSLEDMSTQERDSVTTVEDDGSSRVYASGLYGLYDDGLAYLRKQSADQQAQAKPKNGLLRPSLGSRQNSYQSSGTRTPTGAPSEPPEVKRCILWLGSSIGNLSRENAVDFLRMIDLEKDDTMLIGIDSCDDGPMIGQAYDDPHGVTRSFILEGLNEAGRQLHGQLPPGEGLCAEAFEYVSRYNKKLGRHEAYVKPKRAGHEIPMPDHIPPVVLDKDELIAIECSYKYTLPEAMELFHAAGLRLVQRWTDSRELHNVYLVEKARVALPAQVAPANACALPSMEEWEDLWRYWDMLTRDVFPQSLLHEKPIELRHIPLFYTGHIPGFRAIHLARVFDEPLIEPAHFADIFERGIDPDVDDPETIGHSHSEVPKTEAEWPSREEIREYEVRVRARVRRAYEQESDRMTPKLARVLMMVFEHEAMHAETLVYIALQACEKLNLPKQFLRPDFKSLAEGWERDVLRDGGAKAREEALVEFAKTSVELGVEDDEDADASSTYDPSRVIVWDCEAGKRTEDVKAFKIRATPVSNGEYLAFLRAQEAVPETLFPSSWSFFSEEKGVDPSEITVRTLYGLVPFAYARHWPLAAAATQLEAYATHVGGRLPTQGEMAVFHREHPVAGAHGNVGLKNLHPIPATLPSPAMRDGRKVPASDGGVWMWTSTILQAHEGFKPSKIYPGYSSDFHDGKHRVVVGGSYVTPERLARGSMVNFYQANYPYMLGGARIAFNVCSDVESKGSA